MMSKGSRESVSKKQRPKKKITVGGYIKNWFILLVFVFPAVYGISTVLFSGIVNRAFHYPKECTIEFAAAAESRSRSYSGSRFVVVRTSDCGDLRFEGYRHGLSRSEVADRIDALAGQRVSVDVGVWQAPLSDLSVVGIEGLDLESR